MLLNTRQPLGAPLPKLPVPRGNAAAKQVLATGEPAVGDMFIGPIAKEPLIAVVVPVKRDGKMQYLLLSTIPTKLIQQRLADLVKPENWSLTLLDGKEEVMARWLPSDTPRQSEAAERSRRFTAKSEVAPWSVVLEIPDEVYWTPVLVTAATLGVAILLVALVSLVGGHIVARRLSVAVSSLAQEHQPQDNMARVVEVEAARASLAEKEAAREAAELIRSESERRFRLLFDSAPLPLCLVSSRGELTTFNKRFEQTFGFGHQDVPTLTEWWQQAYPDPEYRRWVMQTWEDAVGRASREDKDITPREYRITCKDGRVRTMVVSEITLGNDLLTSFFDVTERRQVESEKELLAQQRQLALHAANLGWWHYDPQTKVSSWDQRYREIFQVEGESRPNEEILKRLHPEDLPAVWAAVEAALDPDDPKPYSSEYRIILPDGSIRWVEAHGLATFEGEGAARRAVSLVGTVADVTERKRAAFEMQKSEAELSAIYNNAPIIMILIDEDRRLLKANRAALELVDRDLEQAVGLRGGELLKCVHAWDDERGCGFGLDCQACLLRQTATSTLETGKPHFRVEAPLLIDRGEGPVRLTVMASTSLLMVDGKKRVLICVEDITARKQAEEALRESEARYRLISENTGDVVWLLNPATGRFAYVSPSVQRLRGLTPEEVMAQSVEDALTADSLRLVTETIADRIAKMQSGDESARIQTHEVEQPHKDGSVVSTEVVTTFLTDSEGRVTNILGVSRDITERKRARDAILANEKRLQAILKASADPVVVYDNNGSATFVNPAFTRVFGWQPDEVLGQRIPFVPPDQEAMVTEYIGKLYATGGPVTLETKRLTKTGELLNIVISAAGIPDETGQLIGMIVNLTDITQTKRLEAQLRQAQKMEAIGTLAGGIAHDFNNILGAVMGYTELAQEMARTGRSNQEELTQLLKAAKRASSLVRQILTFSRKAEACAKPLSLNKAIQQTMEMLAHTLPKMITIETHLDPDLQLVNADPNQIEQVVMNLATNASDAMPDGGRLIFETKNIVLSEEYCQQHLEVSPGNYVLLMVSDTGQGVEPGVIEHIFDPFFTTKAIGKGTGLGLSTVYGIVKGHGGHVYCYSEPGMGATFKIYLPAYQTDAPSPREEANLPDHLLNGSESILLVDDEPALRDLGSRTLTGMGYRVQTAASGEAALEIFKAEADRIDLVVLDLGMPGMGGHRCLKEMLAIRPDARIVIASGYSANGQVRTSLEAGAAGYVAKPFRRADLLATIRGVLDKA